MKKQKVIADRIRFEGSQGFTCGSCFQANILSSEKTDKLKEQHTCESCQTVNIVPDHLR